MARTKISEFSATPASNTDIDSIFIGEGMAPSNVNDAIRELMAQLKDFQTGAVGDSFNGPVGTTTAAAGAFTTLTTTGNAGVGTSSPLGRLGVVNTGGNSRVSIGDTSASTYSTLLMYGGSGKYNYQIGVQNNVNNCFEITPSTATGGTTFSTPAIVLDASGNLGVGTTSPSARVDVSGSGSNAVALIQATRSDLSITTAMGSDGGLSGGFVRTTTNHPLVLGTNNTERARIDSSGNLLVGTTVAAASSGIGFKVLQPISNHWDPAVVTSANSSSYSCWDIYSTATGSYRFYVTTAGVVNAVSTTITAISDQRLKENIRDLDDGLDVVMALKPRKFDWKEGKGADTKNARGFIAQEFEEVLPDLIDEWKDPAPEGEEPYKAVRADLIPTLVKAIQEQQAIIESLKARLDAANL